MQKSLTNRNLDDKYLNNFFRPFINFPYFPELSPQISDYELFEEGDKLKARIKTPGYNKDEIEVNVENGVLTVSGERKEDNEKKESRTYYKEMSSNSFFLSVALPVKVEEGSVEAKLNDGVLNVEFTKIGPEKVKKIMVN